MSAVGDARKRAQEKASTPDDRDALENEALENALVEYDEDGRIFGTSGAGAFFLADHLLKSDWLVDHDRQVAAKALREVAAWAAGNAVGRVSTAYLRDRANQIEGGGEDA